MKTKRNKKSVKLFITFNIPIKKGYKLNNLRLNLAWFKDDLKDLVKLYDFEVIPVSGPLNGWPEEALPVNIEIK